eukprot:PITA_28720
MIVPPNDVQLRSGRVLEKPSIDVQEKDTSKEDSLKVNKGFEEACLQNSNIQKEKEKSTPTTPIVEQPVSSSTPPFPERLQIDKGVEKKILLPNYDFLDELKNVCIKIPLLQAIREIPIPAKTIKELSLKRPGRKPRDTRRIHLVGKIADINGKNYHVEVCRSRQTMEQLKLPNLLFTPTLLQLADRSIIKPDGVLEGISVSLDSSEYPVDFMILTPKSNLGGHRLILGRPWLATTDAFISCIFGDMYISNGNSTKKFNLHPPVKAITEVGDNEWVNDEGTIQPVFTISEISEDSQILNTLENFETSSEYDPTQLQLDSDIEYLSSRQMSLYSMEEFGSSTIDIFPGKTLNINKNLEKSQQEELAKVLQKNSTTFAWEYTDMKEVYMDDFTVYGDSFEEALENLEKVLVRCKETNLSLSHEKCFMMFTEGIVLGHHISGDGIKVDRSKVEVISKLPIPNCQRDVRSFLGFTGYYRRIIENFTKIASPLFKLLTKDYEFKWDPDCQATFETLKTRISEAPILRGPYWKLPFHISIDASNKALGAVLGQKDLVPYAIYYTSKNLTPIELNYTVTEKEFLAVVHVINKFRHYITGYETFIHTDHSAIRYLMNKPVTNGRVTRWLLLLQEFNITVLDRPWKQNTVADYLSRIQNTKEDSPVEDKFPNEYLFAVTTKTPWYADIAIYLVIGKLPPHLFPSERRKII